MPTPELQAAKITSQLAYEQRADAKEPVKALQSEIEAAKKRLEKLRKVRPVQLGGLIRGYEADSAAPDEALSGLTTIRHLCGHTQAGKPTDSLAECIIRLLIE